MTQSKDKAPMTESAVQAGAHDQVDQLRRRVDDIDEALLSLLKERKEVAESVALAKWERNAPLFDPEREKEVLAARTNRANALGLDHYFVGRLFREVMDASLRRQEEFIREHRGEIEHQGERTVLYQGVEGSYSSMAAQRHFGPWGTPIRYIGMPSFESMLQAVAAEEADFAMLPIENTTAGSINESYDLLATTELKIVGEELQPVKHCLLGVRQVPLTEVSRVYSHPQALAQCSQFLNALPRARVEAFSDTALAAEKVKHDDDDAQTAIASEEAARRYGLVVLKRDIANQRANFTRMVVVARDPLPYLPDLPQKTSLIFATKHQKGALLSALKVFAGHGLSLSKLESRPRPSSPWQYLFYVDVEGAIEEEHVSRAMTELKQRTDWLKILGSYPSRTSAASNPPPSDTP